MTERGRDSMGQKERSRLGIVMWRSRRFSVYSQIALYLLAIVSANLLTAHFGPWITPINAFVFVAFNLTSKDRLQWSWGFGWKLAALIFAGSALSVLFSLDAWRVALASFLAFGVAGIADALVFERLRLKGWLWQVNGSNVVGAVLDSVLFLLIAFGFPPVWGAMIAQIIAKIVGGMIWSVVIRKPQ